MTYTGTALLALMVHLIINLDVIQNKHYRKDRPAAKTYRALILSVMAFYFFDALWGVLYDARLIQAVAFDTMLYFLAMGASVFFWVRFVIRYLNEKNTFLTFLKWTGWLLVGMIGAVLILNLFFPIMFWFDDGGAYHAGDLRYVILALQVLLFISTAVYAFTTIRGPEAKRKLHHAAIGAFGITMAAMVILQVLYPLLPMYSAGCLLGICILHTFVVSDMKDDRRVELEEMIRREEKQEKELGSAMHMAYTDSLTGVKSSHAYVEGVNRIDQRIADGDLREFGVIVFDVNDLKRVNDTRGHDAGDSYIQSACGIICRHFKRSPVFRIGGDEFVVFLEGEDFKNRKVLLAAFETEIEGNLRNEAPVIACGLAVYRPGHDNSYRRIFERADQRMYDRKGVLKAMEE